MKNEQRSSSKTNDHMNMINYFSMVEWETDHFDQGGKKIVKKEPLKESKLLRYPRGKSSKKAF